jgi:aminoglycoside phosphotransferase (APT) family kinase protein
VQGIDVDKVSAWLVENIDGSRAPFTYDLIAGGRSNLTFRVTDANGTRYVLRRPPLGHVLATAHDMAREYKIIAAVGRTNVPVPPALGVCTDDSVNGAPFYVMGFVDGVVLDSADKAALLDPSLRETASHHLIDVMADLHAVDVDAVGLGDLARRDGYIERQLKRWKSQWENSKTRELSAIDEVARRLSERLPVQQGTVIAHGDYRFGNCLTDVKSGRIAASSIGSCAHSAIRWPISDISACIGPMRPIRSSGPTTPHRPADSPPIDRSSIATPRAPDAT